MDDGIFLSLLRREKESFHLLKLPKWEDEIFLFYKTPRDEQIFLFPMGIEQ